MLDAKEYSEKLKKRNNIIYAFDVVVVVSSLFSPSYSFHGIRYELIIMLIIVFNVVYYLYMKNALESKMRETKEYEMGEKLSIEHAKMDDVTYNESYKKFQDFINENESNFWVKCFRMGYWEQHSKNKVSSNELIAGISNDKEIRNEMMKMVHEPVLDEIIKDGGY